MGEQLQAALRPGNVLCAVALTGSAGSIEKALLGDAVDSAPVIPLGEQVLRVLGDDDKFGFNRRAVSLNWLTKLTISRRTSGREAVKPS